MARMHRDGKMNLLAIDSATNACSAALWLRGEPGPRRYAAMRRGHAEALLPMVEAVMSEAGLSFAGLDGIAVTVGPGAFTGLRIGLSAARGLALAADLPLVGVTTLEAIAAAQEAQGLPILVVLDSKRSDVYAQLFTVAGDPVGAPAAVMPRDVAGLLPHGRKVAVAGDAAEAVLDALGAGAAMQRLAGPDLPDAAVVAAIAVPRLAKAPEAYCDPPNALYLRPPDAVTAAERRRGAAP